MRFMSFLSQFRSDHPGIELTLAEGVPDHLACSPASSTSPSWRNRRRSMSGWIFGCYTASPT